MSQKSQTESSACMLRRISDTHAQQSGRLLTYIASVACCINSELFANYYYIIYVRGTWKVVALPFVVLDVTMQNSHPLYRVYHRHTHAPYQIRISCYKSAVPTTASWKSEFSKYHEVTVHIKKTLSWKVYFMSCYMGAVQPQYHGRV